MGILNTIRAAFWSIPESYPVPTPLELVKQVEESDDSDVVECPSQEKTARDQYLSCLEG